jgi:hypothetical protein
MAARSTGPEPRPGEAPPARRSQTSKPRRIDFDDVAFRWSDYDVPLWTRPNTSPLRWNRAFEEATQYLSLSPEGSWAELIRAEGLRTAEELELVSMPMWILRVRETAIADYSTFEKAQSAGFPPQALVDEDYERCQAEGRRLRERGFRGVLAPSAALPGAIDLTLFGRRLTVPWEHPEKRLMASFIRAKRLAIGHPPPELLPLVRHRAPS